jgi:hypothetical protein
VEGAGFAFLALGAQANQMNCPAAIESLVRFSGWDGDVYLITDQEYCFNPQEIIANSGIPKDKFHYIITEENFNRGGFDFEHPDTIGFRMARVRSLNMKTKLFELISDPKIHTIGYVDCDILFTQPQCAQEFISTGPSWEEFPIRFSHVLRKADGELLGLHAGSFVVHREHSKKTLSLWHDQIALGLDEGDNDAFMRMYHSFEDSKGSSPVSLNRASQARALREVQKVDMKTNVANVTEDSSRKAHYHNHPQQTVSSKAPHMESRRDSNSKVVAQLHAKGYRNPLEPGEISLGISENTEDQRNWFEKFIELDNPREFCMQHIPKARCARYGRKKIQQYVDRFRLKSYAGGHMYCTSAFLRPLLYGWFPLGYLPFCPKMEKIL